MRNRQPLIRETRHSRVRAVIVSSLATVVVLVSATSRSAPGSAASAAVGDDQRAASTTAGLVGVTVVIENLAPTDGTWLTPAWVGFHNGSFNVFDSGTAASTALERLAEDGNADLLSGLFSTSGDGGTQAVIPADAGGPQIAPGGTATRTFVLDSADPANRFFSWAAMVIPSNDAFVANDDPQAQRIFDNSGNFLGAYVTIAGGDVLDAGTEVNDELPMNTAFFGQSSPNTGDDENGVVHAHPGYQPPGSGGILDDPMFADAENDFPNSEGWLGIRIADSAMTSHLKHCTVENGDRYSTYESGGGVACVNSSLEIRHSTIRHNLAYLEGAGIYASGATLVVDDCDIFDNHISGENSGEGGGIYAASSDVEITDSRIHDNTIETFTFFGATNSRGGGIADIGAIPVFAPVVVFADGFESGDTTAWSSAVP